MAREMLVTGGGVTFFGQDRPASTGVHRQPAYKLVVALEGHLLWAPAADNDRPGMERIGKERADNHTGEWRRGRAVLVPPGAAHTIQATGAHRCLLVEPWVFDNPELIAPRTLSDEMTHQLALLVEQQFASVMDEPDLVRSGRAVMHHLRHHARLPQRRPPRIQVLRAAATAGAAGGFRELAASVGYSGPYLRQLVRSELGVTLGQLRLWQRLSAVAGTATGWQSLAQTAVAAGFSDQAHLTRTSQRMTGRTPGRVLHESRTVD